MRKMAENPFHIESKLANFWVSQTQKLITAFHHHDQHFNPHTAKFEHIKMEAVGAMVNEWERANESTLRKLMSVEETSSRPRKCSKVPVLSAIIRAMELSNLRFPLGKYRDCQLICSLSSIKQRIWMSTAQLRILEPMISSRRKSQNDNVAIMAEIDALVEKIVDDGEQRSLLTKNKLVIKSGYIRTHQDMG